MTEFNYEPMFRIQSDKTKYKLLTKDGVSSGKFEGKDILKVEPEALTELARQGFSDINYYHRTEHLESLRRIVDDPEASANDRYVAITLLKNAVIASARILPTCQDTGTAIVFGKKGQRVWTDFNDEEALSRGIFKTYTGEYLRYSQNAALTMYKEKNTGSNLPAQIDIMAVEGDEYHLLFMAKGGGSANKMFLFQETKAILNPKRRPEDIGEKLRLLGTAACPPYHLAVVIGGTSAETTMKTLKLASAKYYDALPTQGNETGSAFRDLELEAEVLKRASGLGIGAQFGGKYFAHDVRVVRLPRHGASLPVGVGVSCSADRNLKTKITRDGVFLEQLETDPARFLPDPKLIGEGEAVKIDLDQPMNGILAELTKHPIKTRVSLTGKLIVARDIAHARFKEMLDAGKELPQYFKDHPVYYAGPAKKPEGIASGSFGPTTAARMDPYVDEFQKHGASMVMLAKGNRSKAVTDACKANGGFYLGSIGGPAAVLAHDNIKDVKVLDFEDLGMEAVWQITVKDFPAFIVVDDKGNDFYAQI
ncbi:MAG: fumarate hydratase [bacterium]